MWSVVPWLRERGGERGQPKEKGERRTLSTASHEASPSAVCLYFYAVLQLASPVLSSGLTPSRALAFSPAPMMARMSSVTRCETHPAHVLLPASRPEDHEGPLLAFSSLQFCGNESGGGNSCAVNNKRIAACLPHSLINTGDLLFLSGSVCHPVPGLPQPKRRR